MRWRWWSVAAAVAVASVACEQKRKSPPTRPVASPTSDAAVEDTAPRDNTGPSSGADTPQIKVIEPGRAPLSPLRFHLKAGVHDRFAVTLRITARSQLADKPTPPLNLPAFRLVFDRETLELLEDGSARYKFEVTAAEIADDKGVDALVLSSTKADLTKTVGMSGSGIVDRRGLRHDTEVELPTEVSDQWRQVLAAIKISLDYLSSPFPQEAVGIGAKWEHYQTVTQNGMEVRQTTLFELEQLDRTKGKLSATIKQSADRQNAYLPGLPMGVEAELQSLSGEGNGEVEFDLNHDIPVRASITLKTDNSFTIKAGGAQHAVTLQADVGMVIEREDQ